MSDAIERILASRRGEQAKTEEKSEEKNEDKFFLSLSPGLQENFLELQLRDGLRVAFSYTDLMWLNYSPDSNCLDLQFGSALVTIKGRGFYPKLFSRLKEKRVVWIKEADSEMEDHKGNDSYIEAIEILPEGATQEKADA
jgi:hypothetical protein